MRGLRSILFLLCCAGCLEPYYPKLHNSSLGALVVDGYVGTDGIARVRLSRSVELNSNGHSPAEKRATLTIESSNGEIFSLTEEDSAVYISSSLNVSTDQQYTLHIRTDDGSEYVSDEVSIYPTPPIDNISFGVGPTGGDIEVYVDTHDAPNASGYYLWDCVETFEYKAPLYAGYKLVNGAVLERTPDEILYTCWRSDILPSVVTSTHHLSENIVSKKKLVNLLKGVPELSVRYSILVKQRVISDEEYAFREQLQKSTEQLGSLFAVIPGTVVSNVRSLSNSEEYVLGYFRGQDVKEMRFFIDQRDLPEDFQLRHSLEGCQPEPTCGLTCNPCLSCIEVKTLGRNTLITSSISDGRGNVTGYNVVNSSCGDCTLRGGVTTPPDFW